ncbi:MAG: glycosyltransferase [Methylococcales bacterium]|nr:glycosyltransferase [Methylococcales bacterium]
MTDSKRKLVIIVPSLHGGGSERVVTHIVNNLNRKKFEIILILLKKEGQYLEDLPNDIQCLDLKVSQARYSIFKIIKSIREIKPDVVLSTLSYLNIILIILKPFLPKNLIFFARESSIVSVNNQYEKYPKIYDYLYSQFYKKYNYIICQSKYMRDDLVNNYNIDKEKTVVINNPVKEPEIDLPSEKSEVFFDENKINLLAVGSLNPVKGYDLLIQVIARLEKNYHLTILGEGKEENRLKALAKKLNVEKKISFLGFKKKPYRYMRQADLFVLSSRYEGFPNVVLEANICGLPAVTFNCPGGVGEIIEDGINGFLVENGNIDEMVETIRKSSSFKWKKDNIIQRMKDKYSINNIIKLYEDVLS